MLPDIDLAHDSLFLILDQEGYNSRAGAVPSTEGQQRRAAETARHRRYCAAEKVVCRAASGMVEGDVDTTMQIHSVYCNLEMVRKVC